jgi:hypothetical protein
LACRSSINDLITLVDGVLDLLAAWRELLSRGCCTEPLLSGRTRVHVQRKASSSLIWVHGDVTSFNKDTGATLGGIGGKGWVKKSVVLLPLRGFGNLHIEIVGVDDVVGRLDSTPCAVLDHLDALFESLKNAA